MADIIQDVLFRVKTDATEARNGVAKVADEAEAATTKTNKLSSAFKGLLPAIGVASVVAGITKIAKTSIDAAAKAEGIEQAFRRFGNSGLLDELRLKTKNLVSEVELQKQAVKFEQFNLPLEDLGNLLGFAAQRAQDTGESVDFLTNSIVVGLARKSLPILDNLGLNTKEIAEEAEKAGDFFKGVGTIVSREMAKAEGATETYSQRLQRLDATLENTKVNLGKLLLPAMNMVTGGFSSMAEAAAAFLEVPLSEKLQDEKAEINLLVQSIVNSNDNQEIRISLIKELNSKYPTLLKNIDAEKVTNGELVAMLKEVNKQYDLKIKKAALEEIITDNQKESTKIFKEMYEAQKLATGQLLKFSSNQSESVRIIVENKDGLFSLSEQYEALNVILKDSNQLNGSYKDGTSANKEALSDLGGTIERLSKLQGKLNKLKEDGLITESEYNKFVLENGLFNTDASNIVSSGGGGGEPIEASELVDMKKVSRELLLEFEEQFNLFLQEVGDLTLDSEKESKFKIALGVDTEESIKNIKDFLADPNNKEVIDEVDFLIPIKVDGVAMANSIVDVAKSVDGLIDAIGIGDRAQKEIDKLDELISKQDELVSKSKNLAEKGNADQLALEEARLDNLNKMREEEEQKKQKSESAALAFKKSISIAEIAINLARELSAISVAAAGLAATNPTPVGIAASVAYKTGATIKAVVLSALQAAAVLASGFSEGGYTGDGQKNDVAGTVHKGEFVIDKKTTSKLGLKSKSMDEVAEMFNSKKLGINGNGMLIDFAKVNDSMKLSTDINKLVDINKKMLRTMQSNGMNININEDGFALRTSKMIQMQSIYNAI